MRQAQDCRPRGAPAPCLGRGEGLRRAGIPSHKGLCRLQVKLHVQSAVLRDESYGLGGRILFTSLWPLSPGVMGLGVHERAAQSQGPVLLDPRLLPLYRLRPPAQCGLLSSFVTSPLLPGETVFLLAGRHSQRYAQNCREEAKSLSLGGRGSLGLLRGVSGFAELGFAPLLSKLARNSTLDLDLLVNFTLPLRKDVHAAPRTV